jgi:hypothetical protein
MYNAGDVHSCKLKSRKIGSWGRFFKIFRSVITQSELRHKSKDDLFTVCEKVVTEFWLSYDWPKIFKEPASSPLVSLSENDIEIELFNVVTYVFMSDSTFLIFSEKNKKQNRFAAEIRQYILCSCAVYTYISAQRWRHASGPRLQTQIR